MDNFGRYKILKQLGSGGMGTVYLAEDPFLNRRVALKVLRPHLIDEKDEKFKKRFFKEAQMLAKLDHPNIVKIYDISIEDNCPFISMEYVEGKSLKEYLNSNPTLPLGAKLNIAKQIVRGLGAIHKADYVHRDLKPANILIGPDGKAKITDFGISKDMNSEVTLTHEFLGSPSHVSPEQINSKSIDQRSDIFSFGIILCEMFTGKNPFKGETLQNTIGNILNKNISKNDLSAIDQSLDIKKIILKSLNKNKENRYSSAQELERDLDAVRVQNPSLLKISNRAIVAVVLVVVAAFSAMIFKGKIFKKLKQSANVQKVFAVSDIPYYYQFLGQCGDHICSEIEESCKNSCPEDCPDVQNQGDESCLQKVTEYVDTISRKYTSLKCGDGQCSFIELRCGLCSKDCYRADGDLNNPLCLSFYKPIAFNAKNQEGAIRARGIFEDCYLKTNASNLEVPFVVRTVARCLDLAGEPYIEACKIKNITVFNSVSDRRQNRNQIIDYFSCVIEGSL